jgi:hypothetical protein
MFDTARNTYNVKNAHIYFQIYLMQKEQKIGLIFIKWIKMRDRTDLRHKSGGSTYIYMAFAENPFKYSLAR